MSNFGSALFGSAIFGGDPTAQLFLQIDAETTTTARYYMARGVIDGTSIKAKRFSVGRLGYDPQDYLSALPVNPDVIDLDDPIFLDDIAYWERPNPESVCLYCPLDYGDANEVLGEVAIWNEIQNSPISVENGTLILAAVGHFPLFAKTNATRGVIRVSVQF